MSKKKSETEPKAKKTAEKKAVSKPKKSTGQAAPSDVAVQVAPVAVDEKPKKPKAPVKKPAAGKPAVSFTTEDIGLRAYFISERRHKMGWPGDSTSDWVEAERQLAAEAKRKK